MPNKVKLGVLSHPYYKVEVVNNLISRFPNGSTVLDIGCGDGVYSDLLRNNFVIDGIEIFQE
jgi:2-polyprenyl-3-methyl-5-hydroxy-6-metoxy-1,4-benzoquinol methylase